MKNFIFCFAGVFLFGSILFGEDAFLKQLQEELHKRGDPWIAGETKVSKLPPEQQKKLFGTIMTSTKTKIPKTARTLKKHKALPTKWDWRNVGGDNWMTRAKDQGDCGGCWSFACVGALEARKNIAEGIPNYDYDLSEQFQISCDDGNSGCMGGTLGAGMAFLVNTGVPDEACYPYIEIDASCNGRCSDWASRVVKATDYDGSATESEYRDAIYEGPVAGAFIIKKDFLYYKGGVYTPVMGEILGGHAMLICGWDDSQNAWLIKNSWGEDWPDGVQGFAWVTNVAEAIAWPIVGSTSHPSIFVVDKQIDDANDDYVWDKGETINFITFLNNIGIDATNVNATISTSTSHISITDNSASFGNILKNNSGNNSSNPFVIFADSSTPDNYTVSFNLNITADGSYTKDSPINLLVGLPTSFDVTTDLSQLFGLAFDGKILWAVDLSATSIYKFSQQGYLLGEIPAPGGLNNWRGIAYGNNYLWVHNGGSTTKKIYKVDPANGNVITSFNSPCTGYPTGLVFDGTNLWAVDADLYKVFKLSTTGTTLGSFNIPSGIAQPYMPYDLGWEPLGPNGGSLLLFVAHWHYSGGYYFDSTAVWELTTSGTLVSNHRLRTPDTDGCCIEVNPTRNEYWVNSFDPNKIYRVDGFYEQGIEEDQNTYKFVTLSISPNPSAKQVNFSFNLYAEKEVNISVYDIIGRPVYQVNKIFDKGNHTVNWDCNKMPFGVYFSVLKVDGKKQTKKFVLIK